MLPFIEPSTLHRPSTLRRQVLKTSGGFHTSLMAPAKAKLGQAGPVRGRGVVGSGRSPPGDGTCGRARCVCVCVCHFLFLNRWVLEDVCVCVCFGVHPVATPVAKGRGATQQIRWKSNPRFGVIRDSALVLEESPSWNATVSCVVPNQDKLWM